jgi:hypothetical protein
MEEERGLARLPPAMVDVGVGVDIKIKSGGSEAKEVTVREVFRLEVGTEEEEEEWGGMQVLKTVDLES